MRIEATYTTDNRPQSFSARVHFKTPEEAAELASQFSKSLRVRTGECTHGPDQPRTYTVSFHAALAATGATGALNETSQRRIRSFFRQAERLGLELTWWGDAYVNSYPTREEFERAAL